MLLVGFEYEKPTGNSFCRTVIVDSMKELKNYIDDDIDLVRIFQLIYIDDHTRRTINIIEPEE